MGLFNINYSERLKVLKLQTLDIRRKLKILKIVYKIKYDKFNNFYHLKECYNFIETRNGIKIVKPYNRIHFCDKNFVINSINLFNSLPKDISNEHKFSCFVKKCESYFNSLQLL